MTVIVWFRRDLRLSDHGALAAAGSESVVPLFILDDRLLERAGTPRREHLFASLRSLDHDIRVRGGAGLLVRRGDPAETVVQVSAEYGAQRVLVSGDYSPFGIRRDARAASALLGHGVVLSAEDSPFLHAPGQVTKGDGTAFSVFTPFNRAWAARPVPDPRAATPRFVDAWAGPCDPIPDIGTSAGEAEADRILTQFASGPVDRYGEDRNRTDLAGTSGLGAALHFGEIHPRSIVATVGSEGGFTRQLCWRDFYADVLYRRPDAAWNNVDRRFDALPWRDDPDQFDSWCHGRTGFPMVDAGMRQLSQTGWMHNRVRMVTASFLTKDLLLPWQWGARWFLSRLRDGDVANNSLGWQWVAGTGTDAAPYYRVFNPVLQGQKFDPAGDYVRRYVPELRHLAGGSVHTPWDQADGYRNGYPRRLVDHAEARLDALAAYDAVKRA